MARPNRARIPIIATLLIAAIGHANAQQILSVDALSGSDTPGSTLYKSIRYATSVHAASAPGTTSRILVRGRRSGSNVVLHNNSIEAWGANGPIVLLKDLSIEWDAANSDIVAGMPTPAVLTGTGLGAGSGSVAISLSPGAALTRANASVKGIQIVAFDVGISWQPNGAFTSVGATIEGVLFN